LIVTLFPLKIGGSATLSALFTTGWLPWPNQYSGRYSSMARLSELISLM